MSYSILGSLCFNNTITYTSNKKFLPLYTPVYKKRYNYMLRYPGLPEIQEPNLINDHDHHHPERIKSYYGKIDDHDHYFKTLNQKHKKCTSC